MTQFAATVLGLSKKELNGGENAIELTILVPWEFGSQVRIGDFLPIDHPDNSRPLFDADEVGLQVREAAERAEKEQRGKR